MRSQMAAKERDQKQTATNKKHGGYCCVSCDCTSSATWYGKRTGTILCSMCYQRRRRSKGRSVCYACGGTAGVTYRSEIATHVCQSCHVSSVTNELMTRAASVIGASDTFEAALAALGAEQLQKGLAYLKPVPSSGYEHPPQGYGRYKPPNATAL